MKHKEEDLATPTTPPVEPKSTIYLGSMAGFNERTFSALEAMNPQERAATLAVLSTLSDNTQSPTNNPWYGNDGCA